MKSLPTLLRLQKWRVDEARRKLSALYSQRSQIDNLSDELEAGVLDEQHVAAEAENGAFLYGAYVAAIERQRAVLTEKGAEIDAGITEARAAAAEAYLEQKRIDVLADRAAVQRRKDREKADQQQFDETAAVHHKPYG